MKMGLFQSVGQFFSKLVSAIEGDTTKVVNAVESAATIGNDLVNGLKNFLSSPIGTILEDVITNIPGVGPYASDVLKFLPTLFVDLGWAKAEFKKSPSDIVNDGINYAVNQSNPDVKATNLITLNAHVTKFISGLQGAILPIEAAITAAPAVYHANGAAGIVGSIANVVEQVAPGTEAAKVAEEAGVVAAVAEKVIPVPNQAN